MVTQPDTALLGLSVATSAVSHTAILVMFPFLLLVIIFFCISSSRHNHSLSGFLASLVFFYIPYKCCWRPRLGSQNFFKFAYVLYSLALILQHLKDPHRCQILCWAFGDMNVNDGSLPCGLVEGQVHKTDRTRCDMPYKGSWKHRGISDQLCLAHRD